MTDSFDSLTRHVRVLLRAERLIGEIRLKRILRQTGLVAFAGLIATFGLAMLNVAAYFALKPYWGDALAMLAVGAADIVIAVILVLIAGADGENPQMELAGELRDNAIAGIEVEAKAAAGRIAGSLSLAGGAASLLTTLLGTILRSRKKG